MKEPKPPTIVVVQQSTERKYRSLWIGAVPKSKSHSITHKAGVINCESNVDTLLYFSAEPFEISTVGTITPAIEVEVPDGIIRTSPCMSLY